MATGGASSSPDRELRVPKGEGMRAGLLSVASGQLASVSSSSGQSAGRSPVMP
jgi:hypothetical protein